MRFQNGRNKVVTELRAVQFWSKIILVILNRTHAVRSSEFEIMRMILDQIALYSVLLPLFNTKKQDALIIYLLIYLLISVAN